MKKLIILALLLLLVGCRSSSVVRYYLPNEECQIIVKDEEGNIVEIRGAVSEKEELTEFTLGTKGLGTYKLLDINGLNF